MIGSTETIMSFTAPPVVEVVAGVAFDGIDPHLGPLLGAFWKEQLRDHFPGLEQQPPYSFPIEQFPLSESTSSFPFEFNATFPAPRLWVRGVDGQDLLQLQPGYFACNWRKVQPAGKYDRWSRRRSSFEKWFTLLCEFLVAEGLGQPKITQCEVTYINHIRPGRTWTDHSDFNKVFSVEMGSLGGYPLEQVAIQSELLLRRDNDPYGRLHVKILPAFERDGKTPLYVFELTARGAPQGDGVEGAIAFLDQGREAIDQTFLAMTTREMRAEWGGQQ